jgi:hypothetical protein
MAIGIKKFNWVNRPSAWQFSQAWRSQRSAMVQRFLNDSSVASTAFLNAQQNLSMGMASLAAQASITRAQNEIKAIASQFTAAAGSIDKLA